MGTGRVLAYILICLFKASLPDKVLFEAKLADSCLRSRMQAPPFRLRSWKGEPWLR